MGEQTEQAWGQVQKALRASKMHDTARLPLGMTYCTYCRERAKWAFYAASAASWTTGLLAGLLIAALAWSHLGG